MTNSAGAALAKDVTIYRFGDFTLESHQHCLRKGDQQIHLRPRAFETLVYLVERQGRQVRKQELLDELWSDVVVTENTLSHCIDEVRQALHDDARKPSFIQTIPRLGFKFIANVETEQVKTSKESSPAATSTHGAKESHTQPRQHKASFFRSLLNSRVWPALALVLLLGLFLVFVFKLIWRNEKAITSLAVLPFINLTGDAEQDYFADGMTEALITDMGKSKALRVISRTSVMTYKEAPKPLPEIARQLQVDAIVEGSVLRAGERVRITAKLVDAKADRLLWVESYERDIHDILALQKELAYAIAAKIRIELIPPGKEIKPAVRKIHPKTYDAYLKGRYFWNKRTSAGFEKARQQFLIAIDHDSTYAPAYAGLADTYILLAGYGILQSDEAMARARKYAVRAIALDESLAEAHVSLAVNLANNWDWNGAMREFERAIELNPNYATAHHWYAALLANLARHEESISEMKKARQLAPLSLRIQVDLGRAYYYARGYDKAIQQYHETLELEPNFAPAHSLLGMAYLEKGLYNEAIAELKEGMRLREGTLSRWLGYAYAVAGQTDEAMKMLEQWLERWDKWQDGAIDIALIYVGLGKNDEAFEWLERAYNKRDYALSSIKVEPYWDSLRSDPRFSVLLAKISDISDLE